MTLCKKNLHEMTAENTGPNGRCRLCARDYHRDYYYQRNTPSTISVLRNLVDALDGRGDVKLALKVARLRLRRTHADSSAVDSEREEEAS